MCSPVAEECLVGLKIAAKNWVQQSRPGTWECLHLLSLNVPTEFPLSQGNINTSLWTMKARILTSRETLHLSFSLSTYMTTNPLLEFSD